MELCYVDYILWMPGNCLPNTSDVVLICTHACMSSLCLRHRLSCPCPENWPSKLLSLLMSNIIWIMEILIVIRFKWFVVSHNNNNANVNCHSLTSAPIHPSTHTHCSHIIMLCAVELNADCGEIETLLGLL